MPNSLIDAVIKLRARYPKLFVALNDDSTAVAVIRGELSPPAKLDELKERPFVTARRFIDDYKALLGIEDPRTQLEDKRVLSDHHGRTHIVFSQKHGNARVLGAALSLHYDKAGSLYLVKNGLLTGIDARKVATVTATRAAETVKKQVGAKATLFRGMKPALIVVSAKTIHQKPAPKKYFLAWQVGVSSPNQGMNWIYLVDAAEGKILFRYPTIQTGLGTGYYSHGTSVNSEPSGDTYRLRDTVTSSGWPVSNKPVIHTYDDACSSSETLTNYSEDADDNWDNGGAPPANRCNDQRPEIDIHRFLGYAVSYFYLTHGYNGWNNAGSDAKGHAHNNYFPNNAFWDSLYQQVYFNDGDNVARDFYGALDIVAHEYAHGVKYYLDVLQIYDGESGALNEATSDLFGAFIALDYPADDPWPWINGRQNRLDGTIGRNMVDPSRDAAGVVHYDATSNATKEASCQNGYYPDHYSIRYTGANDYHGVHYDCPIITHALYLMINGGTHRLSSVTVAGIGVAPVEQMLFEVLSTGLLDNTSDFADFRLAFIQVCQTLYPENLDYLAAVKSAFNAVGIGPDLYIRDTLADQGQEPGVLSCMSPDIIVRQQIADAATLTQIADLNNSSLSQNVELGPNDHYVYFRLFNRGSVSASGTFRLFVSPVSTFPTPATWHEVGHYDFPSIGANGGVWVPTAANQCITLTSALINSLGTGHFCFIGVVENSADPPPNYQLIDTVAEFHDFISKSNNYAWRNCDIVNLIPDANGDTEIAELDFQMNGFGRWPTQRQLEIDTAELPEGTKIAFWIPIPEATGLKVYEVEKPILLAITARTLMVRAEAVTPTVERTQLRPVPLAMLTKTAEDAASRLKRISRGKLAELRALGIASQKTVRLIGFALKNGEKLKIRLTVKFPKNVGTRDTHLAVREKYGETTIGQMNFVFRVRKA